MDSLISIIVAWLTCINGFFIVTTIIDNHEDSIIAAGVVTTFVTNSTATIVQFNSMTSRITFTTAALEHFIKCFVEPELDSKPNPTQLTLAAEITRALVSSLIRRATINTQLHRAFTHQKLSCSLIFLPL